MWIARIQERNVVLAIYRLKIISYSVLIICDTQLLGQISAVAVS